ncbi:MAG TPA: hypothetical protein VMF58_00630 [Rhizomicrobium sp.]|nr:hypothetical protein [Rhizomicrobium sp.]
MKRFVFIALAACLLAGCGTQGPIADELTTFNEAQQKGTAQLVLLNVLRARDRQPLAYSHFDVLRGGISASSSAAVGLPFGPGVSSLSANTFATALGVNPGISQDVKPQDDQDFYRGILTPLSSETWALYQDQNWNPDLLFHMFVEDIKLSREDYDTVVRATADLCREHADVGSVATSCSDLAQVNANVARISACTPDTFLVNGKPILKLMNYPGDRCTQLQYDAFTQSLTILGFHIAEETSKSDVGPALGAAAFKDTQWPFALKGSNVEITGSGGTYQFKTVSKDYAVALSNMPCPGAANIAVAATSEIGSQIRAQANEDKAYVAKHGVPEGCEHRTSLQIGITTRSPDGMLYYMGEVARALLPIDAGETSQTVTLRGDDGKPHTLMNMVEGDISDPAVRVTYHGTTYSVPRGDSHLTMQAFELLEQVFALYNRASSAPSTTAVTVVP